MNHPAVDDRGARYTSAITVALAATLLALVAVFVLAKPSGAQDAPDVTLTVDPAEVGFGAVVEDNSIEGSIATRTITVTNTGEDTITIPLDFIQFTTAAGVPLANSEYTTDIGSGGLVIEGKGTTTFTVSFDPNAEGTSGEVSEAVLRFIEGRVDGAVVDTIRLVDEAGNTVTGIDLSGTGSSVDPFTQPGVQSDCTIVGTRNGELLTGTSRKDVICARGGDDRVFGRGASDVERGGKGNDRIIDRTGKRDKLIGQGGNDRLNARDGKRGDVLKGGAGRDTAFKDRGDRARGI